MKLFIKNLKKLLVVFVLLQTSNVKSQVLSVDETIDYINNLFEKENLWSPITYRIIDGSMYSSDKYDDDDSGIDNYPDRRSYPEFQKILKLVKSGNDELKLLVSYSDGSSPKYYNMYVDQIKLLWSSQENKITSFERKYAYQFYHVYFKARNFNGKFYYPGPGVLFYCNTKNSNSCINSHFAISIQHENRDSFVSRKLYNAFKYLFQISQENNVFTRKSSDIFEDVEFFSKMESLSDDEVIIALNKRSNVYYLSVDFMIGAGQYDYIYDTGASSMTINEEIEKELWRKKIINKSDYVENVLYRIADGSVVEARRVLIKSIKIGDIVAKNVLVSVTDGPLLLGNNALTNYSSITLDKNKSQLVLKN